MSCFLPCFVSARGFCVAADGRTSAREPPRARAVGQSDRRAHVGVAAHQGGGRASNQRGAPWRTSLGPETSGAACAPRPARAPGRARATSDRTELRLLSADWLRGFQSPGERSEPGESRCARLTLRGHAPPPLSPRWLRVYARGGTHGHSRPVRSDQLGLRVPPAAETRPRPRARGALAGPRRARSPQRSLHSGRDRARARR